MRRHIEPALINGSCAGTQGAPPGTRPRNPRPGARPRGRRRRVVPGGAEPKARARVGSAPSAPSAGLEPAPPAPEAGALSAELRGQMERTPARRGTAIERSHANCSRGVPASVDPAVAVKGGSAGPELGFAGREVGRALGATASRQLRPRPRPRHPRRHHGRSPTDIAAAVSTSTVDAWASKSRAVSPPGAARLGETTATGRPTIALVNAKKLGRPPRELAAELAERLRVRPSAAPEHGGGRRSRDS